MVVCKFFQQGNCRYGQNCRFEHIYGSKYSYHAAAHSQANVPQVQAVSDEQLAAQVQSDIQAALKGGQWQLSCYAPFKDKPTIPGISDLSPEEARLFIYEAKATNNTEAAIAFINKQIQETRLKYEQLLHPNSAIMTLLKGLYHGGAVQSPFTSHNEGFGAVNNSASSIFRGAVQSTGFGQTSNPNTTVFGQQSNVFNSPQSSNVFGSPSDSAKSIFASANQNVFATSQNVHPFQSAIQDNAKSIFAQATQNVFGSPPSSQTSANRIGGSQPHVFGQPDVFKHSPDVLSSSQASTGSVFQISDKPTTNVFGTVQVDAAVNDNSIYSNMEDLSPCDVKAYESPVFELGFVPELPPPANLCR